MPTKPARMCGNPSCPNLVTDGSGYCDRHKPVRAPDTRPSPSARGYGNEWRKVRAEVLARHGIPMDEWHRYDVDHNPPYDAAREPDHRKYQLIPRLHAEHSRKTAREDGGYGHRMKG